MGVYSGREIGTFHHHWNAGYVGTNIDTGETWVISYHEQFPKNTEILTSEFALCFYVGKTACINDGVRRLFNKKGNGPVQREKASELGFDTAKIGIFVSLLLFSSLLLLQHTIPR